MLTVVGGVIQSHPGEYWCGDVKELQKGASHRSQGELTLENDREHSSHWRGATAIGHHVQEAAGRLGHFRRIGTFQEG